MTTLVTTRPKIDRASYSSSKGKPKTHGGMTGGRERDPHPPIRGDRGGPFPPTTSDQEITSGEVVEDWKKALRGLPRKTQKQLLDYLLLLTQEDAKDHDRDLEMWKSSCATKLERLLPGTSDHVAKGTRLHALLKESYGFLSAFMDRASFGPLTVLERKVVYEMLATLLVARAKHLSSKTTAPLSLRLTFQCSADLPGLFDAAFPGYLEAGLARRVLDRVVWGIGRRSITTRSS